MSAPLKREDLKKFAGQWVSTESPMFEQLPKDSPIIVGREQKKITSIIDNCFICKIEIYLDPRDIPILKEHPNIIKLCATCYFKMEPK